MQLSILNTGLIKISDEVSRASGIIPKKPFDLSKSKFDHHLELFNQYKVLLDIEYHVSYATSNLYEIFIAFYVATALTDKNHVVEYCIESCFHVHN